MPSNKTWSYIVVVVPPSEMSKTPAQRDTKHIPVSATSAPRAQSKAMALASENGWPRRDYIILETFIDRDEEKNAPALPFGEDDDEDDD